MVKNSVRISVVIPTYNRADVIPRTIDSVLNQTFNNWELLIIDDGSTDNTEELILEKYGDDPRIYFIRRSDDRPKGANACRNIGMEHADGKYIALLDSDDEWKSNHLEDCIKIADETNVFYGCYSGAIIRRGKFSFKINSRGLMDGESYIDFLLGSGFAPTPTLFVKRKFALDVKFDESLQRHQDWDFFIRFGKKYSWAYNFNINVIINRDIALREVDLDSCMRFYQKHKNDISKKKNKKKYLHRMFKRAIQEKNDNAEKYYLTELKKNMGAGNLFLTFPYLLRLLERLKYKLKYSKIRRILIFSFLHITSDN